MGIGRMEDGLPIVGPEVDLSQAPPINQKRTLTFINHFITHTVRFLNKFSVVCEEKLSDLQVKIQRIEITLSLLEAKLSSIPGLDGVAATTETIVTPEVSSHVQMKDHPLAKAPVQNDDTSAAANNTAAKAESQVPKMTVSKDPRYTKYFKMINVGVPLPAVKAKMAADGLNPDLLDTPDAPADVTPTANDSDSDSILEDSSNETSSFSDDD